MLKIEMINKEQCVFPIYFLNGIIIITHEQLIYQNENIISNNLKKMLRYRKT